MPEQRRKFSPQFKAEAVQMVIEGGRTTAEVARDLGMHDGTLLRSADALMLFKYVVKNTALAHGKSATFMPKPLYGDNGSGMHCHQSLWQGGEPLFASETGYGGLSDLARHYIGGLLHHAPSLLAFTNPTVNSYHRLVPGYEAPINLVYSARNRSAGLDGIKNKIEPPAPIARTPTSCHPKSPEHREGSGLPGCRTGHPRRRSRVPPRRGRVHPGPDRDLDRLQA